MANFIGPFEFVRMSMVPIGHKNTTALESRSGVDGVFVWLNGKRGEPFQVTTFVDALNIDDALQTYANYESIIGSVAKLVFAGSLHEQQFAVLNVRPVPEEIKATVLGVGGLNLESYAVVSAVWDLVATDVAAT